MPLADRKEADKWVADLPVPALAVAGAEVAEHPSSDGFSAAVNQLATTVLGEGGFDTVLELVSSLAESSVSGVHGVSVSLRQDGHDETRFATLEQVAALDGVQYREREGPCMDAMNNGRPNNVTLSEMEARWPAFAAAAGQNGIKRVLSVPLQVRGQAIGALNLYSLDSGSFTDGEESRARLFAHHASVVLANAAAYANAEARTEQLLQALETRDIIGQAKGVLMAGEGCTPDEAFDMLRRASQRTHRKLRDVAQEVVDAVRQRSRRR